MSQVYTTPRAQGSPQIAEDDDPTTYQRATLNLFAGIEAQFTRIADRMGQPETHIPEEEAINKWPLQMYEDRAVEYLQALGITVD